MGVWNRHPRIHGNNQRKLIKLQPLSIKTRFISYAFIIWTQQKSNFTFTTTMIILLLYLPITRTIKLTDYWLKFIQNYSYCQSLKDKENYQIYTHQIFLSTKYDKNIHLSLILLLLRCSVTECFDLIAFALSLFFPSASTKFNRNSKHNYNEFNSNAQFPLFAPPFSNNANMKKDHQNSWDGTAIKCICIPLLLLADDVASFFAPNSSSSSSSSSMGPFPDFIIIRYFPPQE